MDKDLIAAFEGLNDTLGFINQALATLTQRQFEQGEMLANVVQLLTPKPQDGPSVKEVLENLGIIIESSGTAQVAAIRELGNAIRAVPGATAAVLMERRLVRP
jgi:hypothetical protein